MKRIILYCLILGAMLAIPVERLDVGKLEPVQAVWMHKEADRIVLETDTEDQGIGRSVDEALADLEKRCLGIIYLDTAQYLLVSEDAVDQIEHLRRHLKGSVKVCLWKGRGQVKDGAKYMAAHESGCKLSEWKQGIKLPSLPIEKMK